MGATTLNCPTCGASISSDETTCRYCGTRLATIACPHCFGMMFVGSQFCPHCGTKAVVPLDVGPALSCPDCRVPMEQVLLKATPLEECRRCYGIWVSIQAFDRICADSERQADVLGAQQPPTQGKIVPSAVRYRPCPQCGQLMNRFNFSHTSGVIVDKCPAHGFWFDRNELRRVVEFIQAGGLEIAHVRKLQEQNEKVLDQEAQRRGDSIGDSFATNRPDEFARFCRTLGRLLG